jgi:hypothetical protein
MIPIFFSVILCTRFLRPFRKGNNEWLVYHIVGDNLVHNFQETILMARIAKSMVKIVKQKFEGDDILPQCFDAFASFLFIELSDSSSSEDLTPLR